MADARAFPRLPDGNFFLIIFFKCRSVVYSSGFDFYFFLKVGSQSWYNVRKLIS